MTAPGFVIVSIDGGAATGKSSTARALSDRFNLLHVDTGAFYRTVTLGLLRAKVNPQQAREMEETLVRLNISTGIEGRQARMLLDGKLPGEALRTAEVNENVSTFSAQPSVRSYLLSYQRNQMGVAEAHGFPGLVMEGRDIGSVIFPEAEFRFFLLADEQERLRRRAGQGEQDEIRKRDRMDSERKTAPLICPPQAITINSTRLTLGEVVDLMSGYLEKKLRRIDS
jgi:cytidylate kinase